MYYYIFDIKKCRKRSQVEDIKSYLGGLGISGEFTYPTAAQSPEELVDLGLSKKYTTIVAIGGDEIVNAAAAKLVGRKEALGVIPLETSSELSYLIGSQSWREAADALRYRKISEFRLGQTASGQAFLTHISLDVFAPMDITIEFRDFLIQTKAKSLVIANFYPDLHKIGDDFLDIMIESAAPEGGNLIKKISRLFGAKNELEEKSFSLIRARSLRIFTKTPIALLADGKKIAKTPQLIESTDEKIRLITAKKSPLATD
ncbi:MAG: diacylglycerol kinase family protein [Patescibacteria group bacterium]